MREAPTLPQVDTAAATAPRAPAKVGYFEQALPANVILLSFFVLTLPMAVVTLWVPNNLLLWVYVWLFGMTHFVVTLTIYLQSRNLKHFTSTWRTRLYFIAVPILIFVGFDLLHAFKVGATYPRFALVFWGAVRLFDFNHFNRQSFGVYQMYKGRTGVRFPLWLKRLENWHFAGLTALLFVTFLAGGVFPLVQPGGWLTVADVSAGLVEPVILPLDVLQAAAVVLSAVTAGLFGASLVGIARQWAAAGRPDGLQPALWYFGLQTISAWMGIAFFPLYLAALAIHYVEYHVLMIPRCFHSPLDPGSRIDRFYGRLRSHRGLFYGTIVLVAGVVTAFSIAGMGAMMGRGPETLTKPFDYLVLIALFDGLFVFHYFIEMLIWRFSDPFFRKSLVGLYFAPKGP